MDVRLDGVGDRQAVLAGQLQVDVHVAARVNHGGTARGPVADQVRQVGQAVGAHRLKNDASDGCDAGVPGSVNECWFASFANTRPPRPAPTAPCKNLWRENMVIPPVVGSRGGGGIGLAPRANGLHEWAPLPYPSAAPASTPTEEGFGWRRRGKGQAPVRHLIPRRPGVVLDGGWVAQAIQDAGDEQRRDVQQIESNPRIVKQ